MTKEKEIVQENLHIEVDGETIVSNNFDFETMCIIQDKQFGTKNGAFNMCFGAVKKMFEGTKATEQVLETLPLGVKGALCEKALRIYASVMKDVNEQRKNV